MLCIFTLKALFNPHSSQGKNRTRYLNKIQVIVKIVVFAQFISGFILLLRDVDRDKVDPDPDPSFEKKKGFDLTLRSNSEPT